MQQDITINQSAKNTAPSSRTLLLGIVALIVFISAAFLFSKYVLTAYFTQLSADFTYSVDIISLDNFYDEEADAFSGDRRSVSTFTYSAVELEGRTLDIENTFDVRTISGDPIISIKREYQVDSYSWINNTEEIESNQSIYLFGPHLKSTQDTFLYRHVNYDDPFEMHLVGTESIEGISLNHYKGKVTVDQTANLTQLPGVPDKRGISTDGELELWIEPVTGWLVKYIDNGSAYYYDQQTKERLNPWNKFSNRFTKSSIEEQVAKAKTMRLAVFAITYGIPALVALLGLLLLAWRKLLPRKHSLIGAFLVVIACALFAIFLLFSPQAEEKKIIIGLSRWVPLGNITYDENFQGFKDVLAQAGYEEGKDVEYVLEVADGNAETQKAIAQKFLEMDVDLIFSQTTPGTKILSEAITDIPIVFSIVTYPVEAGLISSNQSSGNNLVGTRNWIPASDHIDNFLRLVPDITSIGFVHRTGEANSMIQLKEFEDTSAIYGISVIEIDGVNLPELTNALEEAPAVDSIFSACDTLVQGEAEDTIIAYAKERRIPSFSCNPSGPKKGDVIALTANFYRIGELSGERADLILQGVSPTALTTDTISLPDLFINKSSTGFFGIEIPLIMLINATEVYE